MVVVVVVVVYCSSRCHVCHLPCVVVPSTVVIVGLVVVVVVVVVVYCSSRCHLPV